MEIMVTLFLFAISVVGFSQMFSVALDANYRSNQELIATNLAHGLIDEILTKHFEDPTEPGDELGINTGEDPSDRTTFDDVDDYNELVESPPVTVSGLPMNGEGDPPTPDYSDFSISVSVIYVDYLEDGTYTETPSGATDYKKATVTSSGPYVKDITVSATKVKP